MNSNHPPHGSKKESTTRGSGSQAPPKVSGQPNKEVATKPPRHGVPFDELKPHEQRVAVNAFADEFQKFLEADSAKSCSKDDVLAEVGKAVSKTRGSHVTLTERTFDRLMKASSKAGLLTVKPALLYDVQHEIRQKFELKEAYVVAGSSEATFGRVGGQTLIKTLDDIAKDRLVTGNTSDIYVGLISGRTVQLVIDYVCGINWHDELCVDPSSWPVVHLVACNVSFTAPEFIEGNATILAVRLKKEIQANGGRAKAYGLNAPLTVKKDELPKWDNVPQTKEVLLHTERSRVDAKCEASTTDLDILLTGVGELPHNFDDSGGSIFFKLARENGVDMEDLKQKRVQGDLALYAIGPDGWPVDLKNTQGETIVFYSAVSLAVLQAMANDPKKAVILVARSSIGKYKIPAIVASLGGVTAQGGKRRRYISHLIVDEPTGIDLARFIGFPQYNANHTK